MDRQDKEVSELYQNDDRLEAMVKVKASGLNVALYPIQMEVK